MSARKGPKNDITDVPGVKVGQAEDARVKTGVTVVLPDVAMTVAGDVRGGGPGTRETDLLDPSTLVTRADAVVLSGGSSYGLGAADGVAAVLGAQGRGFQLIARDGVPPSPIVPAAILYDLANGGDKIWKDDPPYRRLGMDACRNAGAKLRLGRAGAGFGARAGASSGGVGSASYATDDGLVVGAIVALNSFGSPKMPGTDVFWAWPFELDGEFGGRRPLSSWSGACDLPPDMKGASPPRSNTTIGVVAVSAALSQSEARRVAIMAQDGVARAIRPVHGPTDGDCLFVLAPESGPAVDPMLVTRLGLLAADCVARAIARAVFEAEKEGR
jgi:L-aminopeptidase/D-esterase-like protein